ncbi:MAG: hypothetical protein CO129_07955 [Ignavibacteriales bacterium CG_4_9_14_3_um_filter_34_10]|nr:MAG: hypothetical protein CO129_07955 [Ignavibacteriales bacterium CG_4_9_14_3_um_filter_34_10]
MGKILEYFFQKDKTENSALSMQIDRQIEIATAALFIEAAYSDENFSAEEKQLISKMISAQFNLSPEETKDIFEIAEEKIQKSVSFYEFTSVLNTELNNEQKYKIIKNIWRLIFADKVITSHEEHYIRTISRNLLLEHSDFISAKLEVKKELGL